MLNAQNLFAQITRNGGATISLEGSEPTSGYAVAVAPHRCSITPLFCSDASTLVSWISNNLEFLSRSDHYVGAWLDSGELYLDITVVLDSLSAALALAAEKEQLAIFDLATLEEIRL
jgi:hypothetical protein